MKSQKVATCGHLRPLAGSGHLRPLAGNCLGRPLATTCDHLRPLAWSGHLRPLAATHVERPLAATCGHSSGCEWLRVAASGCVLVEKHGRVGILKKIGFAGRILSCLTKPCGKPYATHVFHSVGKILGRSINGGTMVEN